MVSCEKRPGLKSWAYWNARWSVISSQYFQIPLRNIAKNKRPSKHLDKLFKRCVLEKILRIFESPAKTR